MRGDGPALGGAALLRGRPAGRFVAFYVLSAIVGCSQGSGGNALGGEITLDNPVRQAQLEALWNKSKSDVAKLVPVLFARVSPADVEQVRAIEFNVTRDEHPGIAFAWVPATQPEVTISVGFILAMERMMEAAAIESHFDRPGFMIQYVEYVAKRQTENERLFRAGKQGRFIQAPAEFARLSKRDIERLDEDPMIRREFNGSYESALAFVLSHEVAHHVLHHVGRHDGDVRLSRAMETEADAWAIENTIRAGFVPLGAVFALLYEYLTSEQGLRIERQRDHPVAIGRIRKLIEASDAALPRFEGRIQAAGSSVPAVRAQLRAALRFFEEEMVDLGYEVDSPSARRCEKDLDCPADLVCEEGSCTR